MKIVYLEPRNGSLVLYADSGEGCELWRMTLFLVSIPVHLKREKINEKIKGQTLKINIQIRELTSSGQAFPTADKRLLVFFSILE
jgi:hypothetical protein